MDRDLESFFRRAKEVALTQAEKADFVRVMQRACPIPRMTKKSSTLWQASRALSLSRREKDSAFQPIAHYMKKNPVGNERHGFFAILSSFRMVSMVAAAFLLVFGGGGLTAYAASFALPGDALYPIKIHVNEVVERVLAKSPEAKAHIEAKLTERRAQEAKVLAERGHVNTELSERVSAAIELQTDEVERHMNALEQTPEGLTTAIEVGNHVKLRLQAERERMQEMFDEKHEEHTENFVRAMTKANDKVEASLEKMFAKQREQMEKAQVKIDTKVESNQGTTAKQQSTKVHVSGDESSVSITTSGDTENVRVRINGKDVVGGSASSSANVTAPSSTAVSSSGNTSVETHIESEINIEGNGSVNIDQQINTSTETKIEISD